MPSYDVIPSKNIESPIARGSFLYPKIGVDILHVNTPASPNASSTAIPLLFLTGATPNSFSVNPEGGTLTVALVTAESLNSQVISPLSTTSPVNLSKITSCGAVRYALPPNDTLTSTIVE